MAGSSIDWSSLRHAYGAASDIPALLTSVETATAPSRYDEDPWFTLWSALCHQGDVYSASYAALPELIRIAALRTGKERAECLLLAGCIELERHTERAPTVPSWLIDSYENAVAFGAEVAQRSLATVDDADDRRRLEIALAAFAGQWTVARRLLGENEDGES